MDDLCTVAQIIKDFKVSRYVVYTAIKTDPTFPVLNLGPKKNFRIDPFMFRRWLARKRPSIEDKQIPTGEELLEDIGL